jgi:hypothetical protein
VDFIERLIGISLDAENGMFEAFLIFAVFLSAARARFTVTRTCRRELPIQVPQTQSTSHPHARRNALRRDAGQQSR